MGGDDRMGERDEKQPRWGSAEKMCASDESCATCIHLLTPDKHLATMFYCYVRIVPRKKNEPTPVLFEKYQEKQDPKNRFANWICGKWEEAPKIV